jgi:hypothetical protein
MRALELFPESYWGNGVHSVRRRMLETAREAASRTRARLAAGAGRAVSAGFARLRHAGAVTDALLHMFAGELRAVTLRLAAYACAFAALALIGIEAVTLPRGVTLAEAGQQSEWVELVKPFPVFAIAVPEFEDAPRYASFRHVDGGGRRDVFTFGDRSAPGASAVVALYRAGAEPDASEDITASIGELRLSDRPKLPATIETKFGPVTVESFTDPAPGGARRCLRFLRSFDEPRFDLSGWFCNAGEEIVDRGVVACAIDHLTLTSARSEPQLAALFARAERHRTFCGRAGILFAATPRHGDWIEAGGDPRLRGQR